MSALKDAELEVFLPRLEAELKSMSNPSSHVPIAQIRSANMTQSTMTPNVTSATHTVIA